MAWPTSFRAPTAAAEIGDLDCPVRMAAFAGSKRSQLFFAAAFPPLRPAFFFWAVVPPWLLLPPLPLCLPPCSLDFGELAILAARSLDMPLSLRASYCFSFLTFADRSGITTSSGSCRAAPVPASCERMHDPITTLGRDVCVSNGSAFVRTLGTWRGC